MFLLVLVSYLKEIIDDVLKQIGVLEYKVNRKKGCDLATQIIKGRGKTG
jgi:hypothetical protein